MITETVTAMELAKKVGKVKSTILRRSEKEGWPFRPGKNGIKNFYISKLPADVQKALVEAGRVSPSLLPSLAPAVALEFAELAAERRQAWSDETAIGMDVIRDPHVGKWAKILQEATQIPKGWKKRKWIEAVAVKHDTSFQTIYRRIKAYDRKGLAGLKHTKSNRDLPKAWTTEAIDFWVGLCIKREHRKIAKDALYGMLTVEAAKRGWDIGGYESALWWHRKRVTPQLLALQRGGLRALDNTLPPVIRDYSDLAPFEILVGDQHRFDFWVTDEETGEVFRPEGYFWQDLRTRCFYGGALDKKYDSYLMGLALRMGLKVFGAFDAIYTDWGKPETSRYIMSILKDIRSLGMRAEREMDVAFALRQDADPTASAEEVDPCVIMPGSHRKAVVRNAKAKMIEGTFNHLEGILRDHFGVPGHVKTLGGSQEENEVDQKEIERLASRGKLLGFWEFAGRLFQAMDYYNGKKPHRGVLKEWTWKPRPREATPMACLRACYRDGWRPGPVSEEAIDLIFLPRAGRRVDRGRIQFRREAYEHEKLIGLPKGAEVEVRFDPLDPDWLLVFRNERFLCRAEPAELSSMKDRELAARKIKEKRRRRKGFILEYRTLTAKVPDFRQYSEVPAIEKAAALVGKAKAELKARAMEENRAAAVLPAEDLASQVAELEANSRQIPRKPLPKRPAYFFIDLDRYTWIVKFECAGGILSDEDLAFKTGYEATMSAEQAEYWQTVREING